jgi:hypothetical protein
MWHKLKNVLKKAVISAKINWTVSHHPTYTAIIEKREIGEFLARGWHVAHWFYNVRYIPAAGQVVVKKNRTAAQHRDIMNLVGKQIEEINLWIGTYGMGGCGYVGFRFSNQPQDYAYLVYTVYFASRYAVFNGQVIQCAIHQEKYHKPIVKDEWPYSGFDELNAMIKGAVVVEIEINQDACIFKLQKGNSTYVLAFVKQVELKPEAEMAMYLKEYGVAFQKGTILDYLVFMNERGMLWG